MFLQGDAVKVWEGWGVGAHPAEIVPLCLCLDGVRDFGDFLSKSIVRVRRGIICKVRGLAIPCLPPRRTRHGAPGLCEKCTPNAAVQWESIGVDLASRRGAGYL